MKKLLGLVFALALFQMAFAQSKSSLSPKPAPSSTAGAVGLPRTVFAVP